MSESDPAVRTDALLKRFGSFTVLRSVSLEVARGVSLTIFGRNGAGKTTLLKIVAGLTRTYHGGVHLFGENLRDAGEGLRRRVGFVSHETLLYPDLSARDNLLFYARLHRIADQGSVVDGLLTEIGLESKSTMAVRTLSRGMKQRLSLGRAFLHRPELLLLDEPFTGLDERAVDTLDGMLRHFKSNGGSILMASHNLERGWRHADHVAVLDRGSIVYETSVEKTDPDRFRSQYREIISH